jgi:signal transduction histidine kinase
VETGWERDWLIKSIDVVGVLGLCGLTVVEAGLGTAGPWRWPLAVVFGAGMTLPLLVRRWAPLGTTVVVVVATLLNAWINGLPAGGLGAWLAWVVAAYQVGTHADSSRAVLGLFLTTGPAVALGIDKVRGGEDWGLLVQPVGVIVVVWVAGRIGARRRRRAEQVEVRAHDLERHAADLAREAAERERARIARELHDVVTHGMSVMVVQSQAAQSLTESDAPGARRAMVAVEEAGREALEEMRRLLGVIRHDESAPLAPQPRMSDLPLLVQRMTEAGLPVTYLPTGDHSSVPGGIAVSAYRIVQEGLTNVVKHAGAVPTEVRLGVSSAALEVYVVNSAPAVVPVRVGGPGVGLTGMRERVAVYQGTLDVGSDPGGGFTVHAVIPLAAP